MMYTGTLPMHSASSIQHFGVKGQKWGRRRYQNEDGSLTAVGREHYAKKTGFAERRGEAVGKALKNHSTISKIVSGHKAFTGTRGAFRTSTGTQRKAAFMKGMRKGEGNPMSKSEYHSLQDQMSKDHRKNFKKDVVRGAIVGAISATGGFAYGYGLASGAYGLAATGALVSDTAAVGNDVATKVRDVKRIIGAYDTNKQVNPSKYKK